MAARGTSFQGWLAWWPYCPDGASVGRVFKTRDDAVAWLPLVDRFEHDFSQSPPKKVKTKGPPLGPKFVMFIGFGGLKSGEDSGLFEMTNPPYNLTHGDLTVIDEDEVTEQFIRQGEAA